MDFLEIFGVASALLYLFLELKQKSAMWIVGFVSSLAYVIIFFQNKFYADAGMNVYYVVMSVYGFYAWRFGGKKSESRELLISRVRKIQAVFLSATAVVLFFVIHFLLVTYTDSPVPVGDAFITAFSVVGTWMLARKILEHWLVWIVVNFVASGLYFYKDMHLTGVLFLIYGVLSVYGYFRWKNNYRRELLP